MGSPQQCMSKMGAEQSASPLNVPVGVSDGEPRPPSNSLSLPPPESFVKDIDPSELDRYRAGYLQFRTGQAKGATGEPSALPDNPAARSSALEGNLEAADKHKVAVVGSGAFGTCMAMACARNGHEVVMYARDAAQVQAINETHHNPKYLSQFELPTNLRATTDLAEAISGARFVFLSLPCQLTPAFCKENKDLFPRDVVIVSTAK